MRSDDLPTVVRQVSWWDEDDGDRSGDMVSRVVKQIRDRHRWRFDADTFHAGLYAGNCNAGGVLMAPGSDYSYTPSTKPRNVCRMAVDTFCSKITKHRPLPKVQTSMGNWKQQKKSKKTTQWVEGAMYQIRFFERWDPLWVRDSGIFGRGVLKVARRGRNRACIERVFPWEYLIDEWDARYGEPRNCYHIVTMDLGKALALYGKKQDDESDEECEERCDAIKRAATTDPKDDWTWQGECDTTVVRVRLAHAYHICDDIDAHDDDDAHECNGCHDTVILGGPRIEREPFDWPEFPYEQLNYSDPIAGAIGMGLCEMLEGWQEAIDVGHSTLEECVRTVGGAIFLVDNNADLPAAKFMNGGVAVIKKRAGSQVQAITPAPVHPMLMQLEQQRPIDALSEFGFSQMSTQAQRPPGITSGVGLNMLDDIEDERRLPQGRQREAAIAGIARKLMLIAKDIAKDEGEMAVQVPMAKGLLPLKWSEVSLDDFQLRVFPASWLPQTPAAKLEVLNFLFDREIIDRDEFRRLFGGPDYEWELDLVTADRLNVDEKLEAIYDAETPEELQYAEQVATPNNYQDPTWAMQRAQQRYNQGQNEGLPPENQAALRRYMVACKNLLAANAPAPDPMAAPMAPPGQGPMPMPGPAGMAPPGAPMPPGMPPGPPMMNGAPPMGPMPQ